MKKTACILILVLAACVSAHDRDIYPAENRKFFRPGENLSHNLLSVDHSDTTTDAPTRGSLIYGNSTPAWDELAISASIGSTLTKVLGTDGTDSGFRTLTNFADDIEIIIDHGNLAGLADDDHTQYLLIDGSREMTGKLIIETTTQQLELEYDGSNQADFTVDSGGDLLLTASGGDVSIGNENFTTTSTVSAEQITSTDEGSFANTVTISKNVTGDFNALILRNTKDSPLSSLTVRIQSQFRTDKIAGSLGWVALGDFSPTIDEDTGFFITTRKDGAETISFIIDDSGNVQIGATALNDTISAKLEVVGDVAATDDVSISKNVNGDYPALIITNLDTSPTGSTVNIEGRFRVAAGIAGNMGWVANAAFVPSSARDSGWYVTTRKNGSEVVSVTISEDGNVLIGASATTDEANAKLDVIGTTRLGDSTTNYTAVSATGSITQEGSATASLQGLQLKTVTITDADYTALATDVIILFSTGATTRTLTLPAVATFADSDDAKIYIVKKIDSGVGLVTVDPAGSETVDGDTTPDLVAQYESWTISEDGSNWHIH